MSVIGKSGPDDGPRENDAPDPSATLTAHRREHRQAAGADKEKDRAMTWQTRGQYTFN
jgi:hypothetical protein